MGDKYLYSFLLALSTTLLFIPLLIRYSARIGLVDDPSGNPRRLHRQPVPRSGGLAMIVGIAVALAVVLPVQSDLLSFLFASAIIIGFGLLDDIVELSPVQKLLGQSLGVAVAIAGGMNIAELPFMEVVPLWLSYPLTFVFVLGVINGVNFSDGMDGLAAGTTLMALLLIFVLALEAADVLVAVIALAVSAALLGFLRFNTHPAAIFMGDAGSQFLGFAVAWLAITLSQGETTPMTVLMPLLILGIPVMDILQVVPVRIHKKLPLPGPDKEHFHHQIARLGFYQYETVAIIYLLQALLLGSAYLLRFAADAYICGFYLVFVAVNLGALYSANSVHWQWRKTEAAAQHRQRNHFFRRLSVLHPYSGKFFGLAVGVFLVLSAVLSASLPVYLIYPGLAAGLAFLVALFFLLTPYPMALTRLITYSTTALLVYALTTEVNGHLANSIIDGGLLMLILLLGVAIRTTRKEYFWLTTQDLLVLFFVVLLLPRLPFEFASGFPLGSLVFRTFVLLYACEYIIARGGQARLRLNGAAIFSLFLLGIHL